MTTWNHDCFVVIPGQIEHLHLFEETLTVVSPVIIRKKNYMGQKYSPVLLDLTSTFHWHNNQRGKKYLFEIWHTNITDRLLTEIKRRFQNHYYTPQLEGALWLVSLEDCISLYSLLNSKPLDSFSQSVLYIKETHLFCSDLWLKTWFITYSTNLYLGYQKVFMTPLSRKG